MATTSIGVSNLLLYTSMICWLWFLLVLWTRRPSCQQHGWNHTLISLLSTITCLSTCLPILWSLYPTIFVKSDLNLAVFNHSYLQLPICLSCDLYISLFSRNLTSISQPLITSIYDHLSVCLSCDFYISLFLWNLTPISHFHWLLSIERASSISHSTSCTTRVRTQLSSQQRPQNTGEF